MGSSTSKPRKGHEHPKHLPKVGTPANRKWEHEGRQQQVFGGASGTALVIVAILVVALIALFIFVV